VAVFNAGHVAAEQTRPLLDIALAEFLFFPEFAESFADDHAGIIPKPLI
jgi:hypothetical protein